MKDNTIFMGLLDNSGLESFDYSSMVVVYGSASGKFGQW